MNVGDYVRVKDFQDIQHIVKIEKIIDDYTIFSKKGYWSTENIIKSSSNIIYLIEVGDYVNGVRITEIKDGKPFKEDYNDPYFSYYFEEKDIKSIVTKEQFESMEYKVKE